MYNYFPGIGPKGKDVQGLLKNSIKLLGKDIDVFKPVVYMTIIKSIRILALFYSAYCFFVTEDYSNGFKITLFAVLFSPVISYISMRFKAITSWMIYDILRGKETDMSRGSKELKGLGFTIFLYSLIDYIVKAANSNNNDEENGIVSMIKGIVLSIFVEVWDLIKNFSLPAIVIDKTSLTQIPDKLKMIKHQILKF